MNLTYILIGLTVLVSMSAFSNEKVMQQLMMNPYAIKNKQQYYRFLTSGFIHGNHIHLIVNMFSFYFFGIAIERVFSILFDDAGGVYFITLYLMAIIVSDLPTYFKHKNNPNYNSLGASGGVAAMIFAFILFMPLQKIYLYAVVGIPGFIVGILYLAFSWYQGKKSNDNINHDAHLYGSLFGLLFCIAVYPACLPNFVAQISDWISSL